MDWALKSAYPFYYAVVDIVGIFVPSVLLLLFDCLLLLGLPLTDLDLELVIDGRSSVHLAHEVLKHLLLIGNVDQVDALLGAAIDVLNVPLIFLIGVQQQPKGSQVILLAGGCGQPWRLCVQLELDLIERQHPVPHANLLLLRAVVAQ